MTVAIPLAGYAVLLALAAPRVLVRARWPRRSPRMGIGVWLAVCGSVIAATVLAGLSLTVSAARVGGDIASILHACAEALRHHYAAPAHPGGLAGATLALLVVVWAAGHVAVALAVGARQRREHADALTLLACRDPELGVDVVEHDRPAAYCLPGRRHRIVVTRAAVDRLTPSQLAAVVSHERAHVTGRHHLVLAMSQGLRRALGFVPLFRVASVELAYLVELAADDAAAHHQDRRTVAAALLAVATGPIPASALGAAGPSALDRIRRMLAAPQPLPRRTRIWCLTVVHTLIAVPLAIAANPAVLAIIDHHCPLWH